MMHLLSPLTPVFLLCVVVILSQYTRRIAQFTQGLVIIIMIISTCIRRRRRRNIAKTLLYDNCRFDIPSIQPSIHSLQNCTVIIVMCRRRRRHSRSSSCAFSQLTGKIVGRICVNAKAPWKTRFTCIVESTYISRRGGVIKLSASTTTTA